MNTYDTDAEQRKVSAETVLYQHAAGWVDTATAKARCAHLGFDIDFRQADVGAYFEAIDVVTDSFVRLYL